MLAIRTLCVCNCSSADQVMDSNHQKMETKQLHWTLTKEIALPTAFLTSGQRSPRQAPSLMRWWTQSWQDEGRFGPTITAAVGTTNQQIPCEVGTKAA